MFKLTKGEGGEPVLVPRSYKDAARLIRIAACVPGARVDPFGEVEGAEHVLAAVLRLTGQPDAIPSDWLVGPAGCSDDAKLAAAGLTLYQQRGVRFLRDRMSDGAMCNDDVGLGKTLQAIAAAELFHPGYVKVVLCPAFLRAQWEGEIRKWVPLVSNREPNVWTLWPKSDRRAKRPQEGTPDWLIAYYADAPRAQGVAREFRKGYVMIADEVHNLGGFGTKRGDAIHQATTFAAGRISLTASKLYNSGRQLYPILSFTTPGQWGSFWDYAHRYLGAKENEYGGLELDKEMHNAEELKLRLLLFSYRRVKEDVWDQLPFSVKYNAIWLDPPGGNVASLHAAVKGGDAARSTHLHRVAMAKVEPVVEQVKNDRLAGQPGIVFTYLRAQAESIARLTPESLLVMGGDAPSQRLARIGAYVNRCVAKGIAPVVIGTYGALSEGANLQFAKVVNLAALDYTPDTMHQAVGRAARMGQSGEVMVRLFACRRTLDEHVVNIAMRKLSEQMKLEGKREKSKLDLNEALSPKATVDALKAMYERYKNEEA
jgi:hypothetical protein